MLQRRALGQTPQLRQGIMRRDVNDARILVQELDKRVIWLQGALARSRLRGHTLVGRRAAEELEIAKRALRLAQGRARVMDDYQFMTRGRSS